MTLTRRQLLQSGAAAAAGLGFGMFALPARARQTALTGDRYPADGAEIIVHPVTHASLVLGTPAGIVYADLVGGADPYSGLPRPAVVPTTHEHSDHYNTDELPAAGRDDTPT